MTSFYLLKANQLTTDRYYKVYATPEGLYFAKIGGQFHSDDAFDALPIVVWPFMYFPYKWIKKKQEERELEFDQLAQENRYSDMLSQSSNFFVAKNEMEQFTFNKKKSLHTNFTGNGSLTIERVNGKKTKFLIPGHVLRKTIIAKLEGLNYGVPIEEK